MYTTKQQIIDKIIQVYTTNKVQKLSLDYNSDAVCLYNHSYNGVGCAIGCLIDNELAQQLDNLYNKFGGNSIDFIFGIYNKEQYCTNGDFEKYFNCIDNDDYIVAEKLVAYFQLSDSLTIKDLVEIQQLHDCANNVDDFLHDLENHK